MVVSNFTSNQGTQTPIAVDSIGGGTVMALQKLDISPLGASGTVWNGTVGVNGGTLAQVNNVGTLPNIPGGTVNLMGSLLGVRDKVFISTMDSGTIAGGTINAATVSGNLGTIGTIGLATVAGNLGTIGTIGLATVTGNAAMPSGTLNVGTINAATVNTGTINAGTINTGTINAGTINTGTFRADGRTTQNIATFGTQIGSSAAIAATIVGSTSVGVGTSLWLQDVSVTNNNGNVLCTLGFGTAQQGTNVLLRATLGTAGAVGIEKSFAKAVNAGMTNQDLVFSLGAAGTVDLTISYFISA